MNVIVSNRQKEIIDNANIDAIKDLNGLFNVNDLINKFKNYFFSKMILDATSIVNFASREVLTTLANEIGPEKLIILLPATPEPPEEFKKLLIELKIYNFTNNIDDVIRFIERSNTYEDAIKLVNHSFNTDVYVDNSIKEGEDNSDTEENSNVSVSNDVDEDVSSSFENSDDEVINNIDSANSDMNIVSHKSSLGDILNSLSLNTATNNVNMDSSSENEPEIENNTEVNNISMGITSNPSGENVFLINDDFSNMSNNVNQEKTTRMVIGVKNITSHAGSTSLIYMMHQMASVSLKKEVLSIEVGRNDFRFYRNNKMISVSQNELTEAINNSRDDIIFVDLNECDELGLCDQVLFLVEPSIIKLNSLMAVNRNIFNTLKSEKIILNKSMLTSNEIRILEGEAGIKFFACIGSLNDRILNDSISKLLGLLGIK